MKNLLKSITLLCFLIIIVSCSKEEPLLNDESFAEQELKADLSKYIDTSYGLYKGTFSTEDSEDRGIVQIEVISEIYAKGLLQLIDGQTIEFSGVPILSNNRLEVSFVANNALFDFSVVGNGTNPETTNVLFNGKNSFISIIKENTRGAVIVNTGIYSGIGFNGIATSGTWNITYDSQGDADGNTNNFTTQIISGGNDYGSSTGNSQLNCTDDGINQFCDVNGVGLSSAPFDIVWSGTHTSKLNQNPGCSQFEGTWTASGIGNASGTFMSDQQCTIPENDLCINANIIVCGDVRTISTDTATKTGEPDSFCGTTDPNGPGVWYTYNGGTTGNFVTLDLSGSNYDTKLFLYSGECGSLVCIDGDDDGGAGTSSALTFLEENGVTYYIYVAGFAGASGTLNLSVSCVPQAPGNSFSNPIPIIPSPAGTGCSGDTFTVDFGDTSNGIFTNSSTDATCGGLQDIFYSWTATAVSMSYVDGTSRPGIAVYGANGTEIACLETFQSGTLSGWNIGDDLIIQVYDGLDVGATIGFCLETE
jgi:hypothetical protein